MSTVPGQVFPVRIRQEHCNIGGNGRGEYHWRSKRWEMAVSVFFSPAGRIMKRNSQAVLFFGEGGGVGAIPPRLPSQPEGVGLGQGEGHCRRPALDPRNAAPPHARRQCRGCRGTPRRTRNSTRTAPSTRSSPPSSPGRSRERRGGGSGGGPCLKASAPARSGRGCRARPLPVPWTPHHHLNTHHPSVTRGGGLEGPKV